MTDAFAGLVGPVLQHLIEFQTRLERGEQPSLASEKEHLKQLIDEAEQKAGASSALAGEFELARHALVYWVDEILINSSWRFASEYRDQILELDYFSNREGGELFFEHAGKAERLATTDPLETFYLCVALGFRGTLVFDIPKLRTWGERAYDRITASSRHPDRFLADDPRDPDRVALPPLAGRAVLLGASILVSVTVLFTLVCFFLAVNLSSS